MTTPDIIAACTSTAPFLVIGGHAVIANGYSRHTMDLDFLVRSHGSQELYEKAQLASRSN